MFTGIIEALGRVVNCELHQGDMRLRINTGSLGLSDVILGDSIAVSGVCLTVVDLPGDGFWADVSGETLAHTVLADIKVGAAVNLEKALMPTTRLGGHMVSGHVDGVGRVLERTSDARSAQFTLSVPASLAKYISQKGSVCVDGVSLTVNAVDGATFSLNIVPHTLQQTTLDSWQPGHKVNIEVDVIARYLERLMMGDAAADSAGVTTTLLKNNGFI